MINHGRTLLLNRSGADRPDADYFLEEYVPEDFRPVTLPSALSRVHEKLIGGEADDAWANYIVHLVLRAIHATEYASALADLDPRITYLHDRDAPPYGFETVSTNQPEVPVHPSDTFYANALRRKLFHRWLVKAETGTVLTVTDMTGEGVRQEVLTGAAGLTDPFLLSVKDRLSVRFGTYPVPVGAHWEFEGQLFAPVGLPEIVESLEQLGSLVEEEILGSQEEPFPTFRKLWKEHLVIHYRVAGYMLGYIYGTEEARLNG